MTHISERGYYPDGYDFSEEKTMTYTVRIMRVYELVTEIEVEASDEENAIETATEELDRDIKTGLILLGDLKRTENEIETL